MSPAADQSTLTRRLAEVAADLRLANLDPGVADGARRAILDAVGCGVAGARDRGVDCLVATAIGAGESGSSPVFGRPETFAPRTAALLNGSMIHALELDDTHSFSSVHAGGPIVAAALAASAGRAMGGERFLEAVILGYEVACRLGMAIRGRDPYRRGFHPTGICGVFGAATAGGKILGLDAVGIQSAWGIAGSTASGLMSYLQNGAWTKKLQPGWAAQAGLLAALLASKGYLGPDDIFSGRFNFCEAYAESMDAAAFLDELGQRFEICRTSYKRFACCRTIHGPITAALAIRAQPGFSPEAVDRVEARIANEDVALVLEPMAEKQRPTTTVEAQFSMPFGVTLALVRGDAMPSDYSPTTLGDPAIQRIARSFTYTLDEGYTLRRPREFPCHLRVRSGGRWFDAEVNAPLGDYTNPLSDEALGRKFEVLTRPVLGANGSHRLRETILALGRGGPEDRSEHLALLAAAPGPG